MSIYLSSDWHLGHFNCIEYCNRPFKDVHEMDETIIHNLYITVRSTDILYFLGDFAFAAKRKRQKYAERVAGLNCGFHFVKGNHDGTATSIMRDFDIMSVHNQMELLHEKYKIILVHNPRHVANPENYDIIIHGHTHNSTLKFDGKYINVCVEHWDYKPVELNQLIKEWELYERK